MPGFLEIFRALVWGTVLLIHAIMKVDTLITFRLKIIHNLGQIGTVPKTGLTKNFKALY